MIRLFTIFLFLISFFLNSLYAAGDITHFIKSALKNNPKINAERENLKSIKQNQNISKSEFLPSLTITGTQSSIKTSEIIDQSGSKSDDTKRNTDSKKISIDQKIFQGFQGINKFKKSKLEFEKAKNEYKQIEQEIILDSVSAYYDLIFKSKSKEFNLANVNLLEQQVESDKSRLQKGEISLTDLAQSESSLAGAQANFTKADTEYVSAIAEFEKITRVNAPNDCADPLQFTFDMPKSLKEALISSNKNNPSLMIARINLAISERELNVQKAKLSPLQPLIIQKLKIKILVPLLMKMRKKQFKPLFLGQLYREVKIFHLLKNSNIKKRRISFY